MESVKIVWWFGGPGHPLYIIREKRPSDPKWGHRNSFQDESPTQLWAAQGPQWITILRTNRESDQKGGLPFLLQEDSWKESREFFQEKTRLLVFGEGGESFVNELTRERGSDICRALIRVDVWNSQGHVLLWRHRFFTGRILGQPDLTKEQDVLLNIHLETVD